MFSKAKYFLTTTALVGCMLYAGASFAETIKHETTTTETTTETIKTVAPTTTTHSSSETHWTTEQRSVVPAGTRVINFMEFDLNKNGILSLPEIGEMLFKLYDTDGNEIIDNNEYERRAAVTVIPMEKNSVVSYDFDGDGVADKVEYTYEMFMQDTLLTRFDKNKDGLSAHEFIDKAFLGADLNKDKAIDLKEWQASYIPSIERELKEKARFNK